MYSEASVKAHVHCVIIGFAKFSRSTKYLYDNGRTTVAENINRYLMNGDDILVRSRNKPLCDIPKMIYGNVHELLHLLHYPIQMFCMQS